MTPETEPAQRRPATRIAPGLTIGTLTGLLGMVVLAWPEVTVAVVAVLFSLHVCLYGLYRIVSAIFTRGNMGTRVLYGLLGILALAVGALALQEPLQTVELLALLLGLTWLLGGISELVLVVLHKDQSRRGLSILLSVVTAIVGTVMLVYPAMTLFTLTVFAGVGLILGGTATVGTTLWLRFGSVS